MAPLTPTIDTMSDIVEYETQGRIAVITLNRPEARNAINGDVANAMEAAIDQLEADPEVWVGVLRANTAGQERPVFCAGAEAMRRRLAMSADRSWFIGVSLKKV